jgi:hypothetical protein
MEALKMWNKENNKGKWCIPKKGSTSYNEVMEIKAQMEKQAQAQAKKKN